MNYLLTALLSSMMLAVACHPGVEQSQGKDVELRHVASGDTRALFEDGGKVFVKGCEVDAAKGNGDFYTRKECTKDLGIAPLSSESYRARLFDSLKFEPIEQLAASLADLDRDLKGLQRAQLEERSDHGGDTYVEEIKAAEKQIASLQARLLVSKTRKAQGERIVQNLGSATHTRLYFPGIDYQAALAPFGGKVTDPGPVTIGSCTKSNSIGMVFCDIPAGSFVMGSPESEVGRRANELVLKKQVRSFEMMATEVTQAMWNAVMDANPSQFSDNPSNPVERVTLYYANQFVDLVNKKLADEPYEYSLPSEVEWEYAARGGKTGAYGIDGSPSDFAWTLENSGARTNPVGKLKANAYGLFDMHGNVWEWVLDSYDGKEYFVTRGGGWDSEAVDCRSARRRPAFIYRKVDNQGLRLIRTLRN